MRKGPDSWKTKAHPALPEIAAAYRDLIRALRELGPNPSKMEIEEIRAMASEQRAHLLDKHPDLRPSSTSSHLTAATTRHLSRVQILAAVREWLFWRRYGEPLWVALEEEKGGDLEAHKKLVRINDEFWRSLYGHAPPPPFRGNPDHANLMELGFRLGLDTFTAEELVGFFDEFCPCGKTHDDDSLKRLRRDVRSHLKTASDLAHAMLSKR